MLSTYVNCSACNFQLGKLDTVDGVAVTALVLSCPKCAGALGGYIFGDLRKIKTKRSKQKEGIEGLSET